MKTFDIHVPTIVPEMGRIKQISYIVEDIEEAIAHWHNEHGIGPFVVARDAEPLFNAFYRGKKSETVILDLAFAYAGDLQIELIKLKQTVPSIFKEVLDRGQRDLHHYGTYVADFEKAREFAAANGFKTVVETGVKGIVQMHYVEAVDFSMNIFSPDEHSYMKTPEGYGVVLEIVEDNAMTRPYFDNTRELVDSVPDGQLIKDFKLNDIMP